MIECHKVSQRANTTPPAVRDLRNINTCDADNLGSLTVLPRDVLLHHILPQAMLDSGFLQRFAAVSKSAAALTHESALYVLSSTLAYRSARVLAGTAFSASRMPPPLSPFTEHEHSAAASLFRTGDLCAEYRTLEHLYQKGQIQTAQVMLEDICCRAPHSVQVRYHLAKNLENLNRFEDATIHFEFVRCANLADDDPMLCHAKAHMLTLGVWDLIEENKLDEALAAVDLAFETKQDYPFAHMMKCHLLSVMERWEEAAVSGRRAAVVLEGYSLAHASLASAHYCLGEWDAAEASCRRAVSLDDCDPEKYFFLGEICIKQGQWREAEDAFRKCISFWPHSVEAHVMLGCSLAEQMNRWHDAMAGFRRAASLCRHPYDIETNLDVLIDGARPWSATEASCRLAISLCDDWADAHVALGLALAQQGV